MGRRWLLLPLVLLVLLEPLGCAPFAVSPPTHRINRASYDGIKVGSTTRCAIVEALGIQPGDYSMFSKKTVLDRHAVDTEKEDGIEYEAVLDGKHVREEWKND